MNEIKQEEIRVKEIFDKFTEYIKVNNESTNYLEGFSVLVNELKVNKVTIEALKNLTIKESNVKRKALYELVLNTMIEFFENQKVKDYEIIE